MTESSIITRRIVFPRGSSLPDMEIYIEMPRAAESAPIECRYSVNFGASHRRFRTFGEDSVQALLLAVDMVRQDANFALRRAGVAETYSFNAVLFLVGPAGEPCGDLGQLASASLPEG